MRRLPLVLLLLAVVGAGWLFHDTLFDAFGFGAGEAHEDDLDDASLIESDDDDVEQAGERGPTLATGGSVLANAGKPSLTDAEAIAKHALGKGPPPATVHFAGVVRLPDGSPAAGVEVVAVTGGSPVRFKTNAQGNFAQNLSAGRYDLLFRDDEGNALLRRWFRVDGALTEENEFRLRETGIVVVTVLRGADPVPGVTIEAAPQGELIELLKMSATTGADGIARIESMPNGRYDLIGEIPEGPRLVHRLSVNAGRENAATIRVPGGVTFSGVVRVGADGPPVADAAMELHVRASKSAGTLIVEFTSASDGTFDIVAPRGRPVLFTVLADGYAPFPETRQRSRVLKSLRNLRRNKPVKYDVKLDSGIGISGRVLDGEGEPVPGVRVELRRARQNQSITSVESDASGVYAFPHLAPEVYDLGVLTPGVYPASTERLRFTLKKEPIEKDIVVMIARRVFGKVVTSAGENVAAARVWVVGGGIAMRSARDAGRLIEAYTSSSGTFLLADLPTDRNLSIRASMGDEEAEPVHIQANDESPGAIRLVMRATGTIKGTVVDLENNKPLRNVRIQVRPEPYDGRTGMTLRSRNDGTFTTRRLIPGKWKLIPTLQGYLKHAGDIVNIPASEVDLTLRMDPGLVFEGVAVTDKGQVLSNATITVRKVINGKQSGRWSVRSNSKGVFRVTGVDRQADEFRLTGTRNRYNAVVRAGLRDGQRNMRLIFRPRGRR